MRYSSFILLFFCSLYSFAQDYASSLQDYRDNTRNNFLKDEYGPLRKENVAYLAYFPANEKFILNAKVEFLHQQEPFRMPTYDGTSNLYRRYAILHFDLEGQVFQLTAYQSEALLANEKYRNYLFLPFMDDTNGEETYGGGRYIELDASEIKNGSITVDFNKAYNPYCAYSSGYRCPQPPFENSIGLPVTAGEKNYKGPKNERPVNTQNTQNFTQEERSIILSGDTTTKLHVYQTTNEKELAVLKKTSQDIDLKDPLLDLLAKRMLLTVQDSAHAGVGIAAPQVGVNKNLIWVQRFDKSGEPFECYINPKIIWRSRLIRKGTEGCLSIPNRREDVNRSYAIRLQYWDRKGNIIEENIEGFTAVIFQHEVDHLYGILYPDRLDEQENKKYNPLADKINFQIEPNTLVP